MFCSVPGSEKNLSEWWKPNLRNTTSKRSNFMVWGAINQLAGTVVPMLEQILRKKSNSILLIVLDLVNPNKSKSDPISEDMPSRVFRLQQIK